MYESLNALENGNLQMKIRKPRCKKMTEDSPEVIYPFIMTMLTLCCVPDVNRTKKSQLLKEAMI